MDLERASSKPSYNLYYGIGGTYGASIKEDINFRFGADLLYFKPQNVRGYYDFCINSNEKYWSCLPVVTTIQLQIPIELEFIVNSDYARYKTFFSTGLMPVLSLREKGELIEYDDVLNEVNRYEIDDGLKIPALYFLASVTTEFLLFGNFRFFIEPSVRVSSSFKRQNYSNPIHYFIMKSGIRARIEK